MYTRFTHVTNELKSLAKSFTTEELVRNRGVGKENPAVFASIVGSEGHSHPGSKKYE